MIAFKTSPTVSLVAKRKRDPFPWHWVATCWCICLTYLQGIVHWRPNLGTEIQLCSLHGVVWNCHFDFLTYFHSRRTYHPTVSAGSTAVLYALGHHVDKTFCRLQRMQHFEDQLEYLCSSHLHSKAYLPPHLSEFQCCWFAFLPIESATCEKDIKRSVQLLEAAIFFVLEIWAWRVLISHMPQNATQQLVNCCGRVEVSIRLSCFNHILR